MGIRYVVGPAALAVVLAVASVVLALTAATISLESFRAFDSIDLSAGEQTYLPIWAMEQEAVTLGDFAGPVLLAAIIAAVTAIVLFAARPRIAARS